MSLPVEALQYACATIRKICSTRALRQQDGEQSLDARHRGDLRVACVGERGKGAGACNGGARSGGPLGGLPQVLRAEGARGKARGAMQGSARRP